MRQHNVSSKPQQQASLSVAVYDWCAGIAVNMVMLSTVFLVGIVMLVAWHLSVFWTLLFVVPYVIIEGTFLSANLLNIPHGGWFSLSLAAGLSSFCLLWIWGSAQKAAAVHK
eukprot:GHUV01058959.1.p1 GENE.GHUV01058959.1~~GHUV01058959.1.p1  ORF type:complete len:112 (-),score=28.47 GHUV01058959.1:5-340(-)